MLGPAGTGATIPVSAIRGVGPELITVDMPAPPGEEIRTIPATVRIVTSHEFMT